MRIRTTRVHRKTAVGVQADEAAIGIVAAFVQVLTTAMADADAVLKGAVAAPRGEGALRTGGDLVLTDVRGTEKGTETLRRPEDEVVDPETAAEAGRDDLRRHPLHVVLLIAGVITEIETAAAMGVERNVGEMMMIGQVYRSGSVEKVPATGNPRVAAS
jgi:hypothetical protein